MVVGVSAGDFQASTETKGNVSLFNSLLDRETRKELTVGDDRKQANVSVAFCSIIGKGGKH